MEINIEDLNKVLPSKTLQDVLEQLQKQSANNYCFDCNQFSVSWASVTYGILFCTECAGRHRALGVSISKVKSLYHDTWTVGELLRLVLGSNAYVHDNPISKSYSPPKFSPPKFDTIEEKYGSFSLLEYRELLDSVVARFSEDHPVLELKALKSMSGDQAEVTIKRKTGARKIGVPAKLSSAREVPTTQPSASERVTPQFEYESRISKLNFSDNDCSVERDNKHYTVECDADIDKIGLASGTASVDEAEAAREYCFKNVHSRSTTLPVPRKPASSSSSIRDIADKGKNIIGNIYNKFKK